MPRTRTRSAYSPQEPPPPTAPPDVVEVVAWAIASRNWSTHLPDALLGVQCEACGETWPCDAWHIADDVITDCLEWRAEPEPHHDGAFGVPGQSRLGAELRASHSTSP